MKHSDALSEATAQEIFDAQKLVKDRWYQVSRSGHRIAQLPEDVTAAMARIYSPWEMRNHWSLMSQRDIEDHYLRMHAPTKQLTPKQFALYRAFGGGPR